MLWWISLSRNFQVQIQVNFMGVSKIEAVYERPCINKKVEQGLTSMFMCDLP